jgi:hypothetical protein
VINPVVVVVGRVEGVRVESVRTGEATSRTDAGRGGAFIDVQLGYDALKSDGYELVGA